MNRGSILVAATLTIVCGCAQIPTAQLTSYHQAFEQARIASDQVLLDFDRALSDNMALKRVRDAKAANAPSTSYPLTWAAASQSTSTVVPDAIEARRRAFKVVGDYNAVLVQLAEGKSVEDVKASASGLLASTDKFLTVVKGSGIPGLSAITGIVSTFVELLEKARLREEFVKAVQKGAPVVHAILDALIADIGDHYDAHATIVNREQARNLAAMRLGALSVQRITARHRIAPDDLDKLEKSINDQISVARNDAPGFSIKLKSGGDKAPEFAGVPQAQVKDDEKSIERAAKSYADNIAAMKALAAMLEQYRKLLRVTQSSLTNLVKSLDAPVDVATSADEILAVVFSLRRDLGELHAARAGR